VSSQTLGAATATGAGTVAVAGAANVTLGALGLVSVGGVLIDGALVKTFGALTLIATSEGAAQAFDTVSIPADRNATIRSDGSSRVGSQQAIRVRRVG
jgi:hypothetical protein